MAKQYSDDVAILQSQLQKQEKRNDELAYNLEQLLETEVSLLNPIKVGWYIADFETGRILAANSAYAEGCGIAHDQIVGTVCWENLGHDDRCALCPYMGLVNEKGEPTDSYVWENYVPSLGVWLRLVHRAIKWTDGRLVQLITYTNVTELRVLEAEREHAVYYDMNLNSPNFIKLQKDLLGKGFKDSSIVCLQLKGLRKVNYVYGREKVDLALEHMRDWFANLNMAGSAFYRVGGDLFVLRLMKADIEKAQSIISMIQQRFWQPWEVYNRGENQLHIFFDLVIGYIDFNITDIAPEDLNNVIDEVMEDAEHSGKVIYYDKKLRDDYHERTLLELNLRTCVREHMSGFYVQYQPICNHATGLWYGLEALCRWDCPNIGEMKPTVFIPLAEQCGLVGDIDLWVIQQAIEQVEKWGMNAHAQFILNVNLSFTLLSDSSVVKRIQDFLSLYNLSPEKLCIEITNGKSIHYSVAVLKTISEFKELGVVLALDEFGTDFASLARLRDLPVNALKLDRYFLQNIENDAYLKYMLQGIVELAHSANMSVIAEKVESEREMLLLADCGVDGLQGKLFLGPQNPDDIEKNLFKFYNSSSYSKAGRYNLDIPKIRLQDGNYPISPKMYAILNKCIQQLLYSSNMGVAMEKVLEMIGNEMRVSRVFIYQLDDEKNQTYSNNYEWCEEGVARDKEKMQNVTLPTAWDETLERDGVMIVSDTTLLPDDVRGTIIVRNIFSTLIIPLWNGGQLVGFVGFDECKVKYRIWAVEELQMLYHLGMLFATLLPFANKQREMKAERDILQGVLAHIRMPVFVSDPDTYQVIFANQEYKEFYKQENVQGKCCYDIMYGKTEPCEYCHMPELLNGTEEYSFWDFYNESRGKHLRITDTMVEWSDGKKVHLQYAFDVTTIMEYQQKLKQYVLLDIPTNTLNRHSLLDKMAIMVYEMLSTKKPLSLCFVDLDGLKRTNDVYGHSEGDLLILRTVDAIRDITRRDDIIGRYGGDEFIVVFPNCLKQTAEKRLARAQRILSDIPWAGSVEGPYSFSYGIAELSEVEGNAQVVQKLIQIADERMYESKKAKKVQRI